MTALSKVLNVMSQSLLGTFVVMVIFYSLIKLLVLAFSRRGRNE